MEKSDPGRIETSGYEAGFAQRQGSAAIYLWKTARNYTSAFHKLNRDEILENPRQGTSPSVNMGPLSLRDRFPQRYFCKRLLEIALVHLILNRDKILKFKSRKRSTQNHPK